MIKKLTAYAVLSGLLAGCGGGSMNVNPTALSPSTIQPEVTMVNVTSAGGSAYASTVMAEKALTHYYRFNETSGATAADLKGGVNGTYSGTYALGATDLVNGPGASLSVKGSGYASSTPVLTAKFSVEFWFALSPSLTSPAALVANASTPTTRKGFSVIYGGPTDNVLYFYIGNRSGTANASIASAKTFVANKPYHVVATYDGVSAMTLYINGKLAASGNFVGGTPNIGDSASTWMGATFTGNLQEVAFYNAPLSAASVTTHHTAGVAQSTVTPIPAATPVPTATPKPTAVPTATPKPTATPVPTAIPKATPTPPPGSGPVSNPSSLAFLSIGAANAQKLTITQTGYTGPYGATNSGGDPTAVTTSVAGNVVTVTPQHNGATNVVVTGGSGKTVTIPVGITVTTLTIQ